MDSQTNKSNFIGKEALTKVADQVGKNIIMGPAYDDPELLDRLGIQVISGVQFKKTDHLLVRKGGTTRRKEVGKPVANKIGFIKERVLVAKLTWNRFVDNIDNYVETVFGTNSTPGGNYPMSTAAVEAILKSYAEDLTVNLFFGDMTLEDSDDEEKKKLSLYDGFHTVIKHDIEDGIISEANGNLIPLSESITAPDDAHDSTPFDIVMEWYTKWDARLRQQKVIKLHCDILRGIYIAQGYANKYHGNEKVKYLPNGNFTVPEMPRVEFCPSDAWGIGGQLMATVKDNLQYGVDNLNAKTFVKVRIGSDDDEQDVIFQIQSIQGTRLMSPLASMFVISDGTMRCALVSGDYQKTHVIVTANDIEGEVEVNGVKYTTALDIAEGTVVKFEAKPKPSYKFVQWSNGKKDAVLNLTTTGNYLALTAIFAAE